MKKMSRLLKLFEFSYAKKTVIFWTEQHLKTILEHYCRQKESMHKVDYALLQASRLHPECVELLLMGAVYYSLCKEYTRLKALLELDAFANSYDKIQDYLLFFEGNFHFDNGNYVEAMKFYENIKDITVIPPAIYRSAECHSLLGNSSFALDYYKQYCRYGNIDGQEYDLVFFEMNKCWAKLRNFDDAVMFYENFVYDVDPFNAYAWFALSINYVALNNMREAERALLLSIAILPNNSTAFFNLANIYSSEGKYLRAINFYDHVIHYDGEDSEVFLLKGECYFHLNQFDRALKCFESCLKIDDKYSAGYYWTAQCYISMGNYKKALTSIKRAIKLEPENADFYNLRAMIYSATDNEHLAYDDYLNSVKLDPDNVDNVVDMADFMLQTEQFDVPVLYLLNVGKVLSNDARVPFYIGLCMFFQGDFFNAYQRFNEAVIISELHPNNNMVMKHDNRIEPKFMNSVRSSYNAILDDETVRRIFKMYIVDNE